MSGRNIPDIYKKQKVKTVSKNEILDVLIIISMAVIQICILLKDKG